MSTDTVHVIVSIWAQIRRIISPDLFQTNWAITFPRSCSSNDYFLCVWRRTWGQCRWSKGLIPTRPNPARLKYRQSGEADMSEGLQAEGWPPERPGHTRKNIKRDEILQPYYSQGKLIFISNVCLRKTLTETYSFHHKSSPKSCINMKNAYTKQTQQCQTSPKDDTY